MTAAAGDDSILTVIPARIPPSSDRIAQADGLVNCLKTQGACKV